MEKFTVYRIDLRNSQTGAIKPHGEYSGKAIDQVLSEVRNLVAQDDPTWSVVVSCKVITYEEENQ